MRLLTGQRRRGACAVAAGLMLGAALLPGSATAGDVGAASKAMFDTCKSCHDQFRKPED